MKLTFLIATLKVLKVLGIISFVFGAFWIWWIIKRLPPVAPTSAGASAGGTSATTTPKKGVWSKVVGKISGWFKQEDISWKNWLVFPAIGISVILLVTTIAYLLLERYSMRIPWLGTMRLWLILFFALCFWFFGKWKNLDPGDIGYKTCFGKAIQKLGEGPALEPPGVFKITTLPGLQFSVQVGARETRATGQLLEAGFISKETFDQCGGTLEVNFASPEEAKFTLDIVEERALAAEIVAGEKKKRDEGKGERIKGEIEERIQERKDLYAKDPLNKRLTGKVRVTLLAQIDRENIFEFARNIGNLDRAVRELDELVRAVVGRWCGKRTAAFVTRNLGLLGREVLFHTEDLVGDRQPTKILLSGKDPGHEEDRERENVNPKAWGLDIIRVEVHAPEWPESVTAAIASVAAATATAAATKVAAGAEKTRLTEVGEGNASAEQSRLLAEAVGAKALGEVCDASQSAQVLALAEKRLQLLAKANLVVTPNADLLGLAATLTAQGKQSSGEPQKVEKTQEEKTTPKKKGEKP